MSLTDKLAIWRAQHQEWYAAGAEEDPPTEEEALRMVVFEAINEYLDAHLVAIEAIDCESDGSTYAAYEDHISKWLDLYADSEAIVHTGAVALLPVPVGGRNEA